MDTADDTALARCLAGHRVLLCFGLLGEVMAGLRIDYMRTQAQWLRALGVSVARVPLPTAAPIAGNAARIAAAIAADPAPAILVAHSKGGIEALAALLHPGIAPRCAGFLALQSPFRGSPLADAALGYGPLREAADKALRIARLGSGEGLADLTCGVRAAWMTAHEDAIRTVAGKLPVATVATALAARPGWRDSAYQPLARWMERQGAGPSDGLVPVASTMLPGASHKVLEGGHRALVAAAPGRDPVGFLRGELLALLSPS